MWRVQFCCWAACKISKRRENTDTQCCGRNVMLYVAPVFGVENAYGVYCLHQVNIFVISACIHNHNRLSCYSLPRYQSVAKYANVVSDHKKAIMLTNSTVRSWNIPQSVYNIHKICHISQLLHSGITQGPIKYKRYIRKLSWTEINENIICLYVWFYVDDLLWNIPRNITAMHHASNQKKSSDQMIDMDKRHFCSSRIWVGLVMSVKAICVMQTEPHSLWTKPPTATNAVRICVKCSLI